VCVCVCVWLCGFVVVKIGATKLIRTTHISTAAAQGSNTKQEEDSKRNKERETLVNPPDFDFVFFGSLIFVLVIVLGGFEKPTK